ncbi:hypothetical protein C9I56_24285 [Paraburkholderia caribensis]|uniref:Uncharacterized protein n=1 Tax=Paraburkholderia caribensis TaxID=75105 RepID=A0A9Q6SA87_9BURK|nr:hypothetical protein C9I56_24285 [Paraburkholderia caribensis]QLB67303.1 hypothetical protein A9O66_33160 [Paraburkholderia caribensis]
MTYGKVNATALVVFIEMEIADAKALRILNGMRAFFHEAKILTARRLKPDVLRVKQSHKR